MNAPPSTKIASRLVAVLRTCADCDSMVDLKEFIRTRLRDVFPHQMAMFGLCEIHSKRVLGLINVDFPIGYLRRVIRSDLVVAGGLFRDWLCDPRPSTVYIDQNRPGHYSAERDAGITSFACHGVVDLNGRVLSYFAFARRDHHVICDENESLRLIVPCLHEVLARLLTRGYPANDVDFGSDGAELRSQNGKPSKRVLRRTDLTKREQEVLLWIAAGKTNWEIGKILQISEFTVKNHVKSLLTKLLVSNRTQAASTAVSEGLIAKKHASGDEMAEALA